MQPILSIIIPTKDRYIYLESCLKSLLTYNNSQIEIIITDNSSHRQDLTSVLGLFGNIKYYFIEKPISQVENFELALEKVTAKYITMMGDDDGLSEVLLNVVKYMDDHSIDALNAPFVSYFWPDVTSKNKLNDFSGKMFLEKYSYSISNIKAFDEVKKCLNLGATSLCNLPRMYYGIIRKDVLDKVKDLAGCYFPGPSPDMANAFSSALFVTNFVYFDVPLFIAGNSAKSAAGMGLAGAHTGSIKGNPLLPKDCYLKWSSYIPLYWSGPTIWAESVIKVIEKCNASELEKLFNYYRLYAACMIFNPEHKGTINFTIQKYRLTHKGAFQNFQINNEKLKVWFLRVRFVFKNLLKKIPGRTTQSVISEINDIESAALIINKFAYRIKAAIPDD